MKVVIAPDSFKGTMSSIEICEIIECGIKKVIPTANVIKIPVADGGEGTVDAFLSVLGGTKRYISVKGPLFEDVEAFYGVLNDGNTAIIEMAAASGLMLVGERKNPCLTTTYGTGELIKHALNAGCNKIIIGIGGSATNDAGIGMAAALGVRFLDNYGNSISLNGAGLEKLCSIDLSGIDKNIGKAEIIVLCDVDNPLYGTFGAAYVYAAQKGADEKMIMYLDTNLRCFANVVKRCNGVKLQNIPGAGAAGGLGAGLVALVGASLRSGIKIILDMVKFDDIISDADLILTGEGRIDGQSARGKVLLGIAERAKKKNIPVVAVVGQAGDGCEILYEKGISAIFSSIREAGMFNDIKSQCRSNLMKTVEDIFRLITIL